MLKDGSFVYLIGNKLDLDSLISSSTHSITNFDGTKQRQIEFEEGQEFAQARGLLFNEVSCSKRKNIDLVMKMIKIRVTKMLGEQRDLP